VVHIGSRPSLSSNPAFDLANTSDAPDLAVDDINPLLHEQAMIESFN